MAHFDSTQRLLDICSQQSGRSRLAQPHQRLRQGVVGMAQSTLSAHRGPAGYKRSIRRSHPPTPVQRAVQDHSLREFAVDCTAGLMRFDVTGHRTISRRGTIFRLSRRCSFHRSDEVGGVQAAANGSRIRRSSCCRHRRSQRQRPWPLQHLDQILVQTARRGAGPRTATQAGSRRSGTPVVSFASGRVELRESEL
jgi:hypothetical protein